jgi:hypothetical protein
MIEKTLYTVLSQLNISLFPLVIPQEQELPSVNYFRLKTMPTNTLKGMNRRHDNAQFQIDVWGKDYLNMAEISEQIIDGMGKAYGADSLLLENRDEAYDSQIGSYHRILVFSLREIRSEGGLS